MGNTSGWERLCRLLDDDEELWPRVRQALEGSGEDPWDALISGLDDSGALVYLETDDTGMELAEALAGVPRVFRLQLDLGPVNDTDDLDDALREAERILAGRGFRLVGLPEDEDDAVALVVVPSANVAEIEDLAQSLGGVVTTFD